MVLLFACFRRSILWPQQHKIGKVVGEGSPGWQSYSSVEISQS